MRLGTSLRSRSPAQTFACARRWMRPLGISRVTDVTRLDRLGLPVCASVRPRGKTLCVHAGKGLTVADARVGALMEALEVAVAEKASASATLVSTTLGQLEAALPAGLRLADFAPRLGVAADPTHAVTAVRCIELQSRRTVLLPAELVLLPAPAGAGPTLFGWSSNGLASGNTLDEATLHGLFEVLERDARTLNRARDASARLANAALPPPFAAWAGAWRREGVELIVRHLPNDFGLACFEAFLHEHASTDVNLAAGGGLHTDRGVALARAITEAAQARLSTIHGGRDDLTRFYAKYQAPDAQARLREEEALLAVLAEPTRTVAFEDVPHQAFTSAAAALTAVRRQLAARGFGRVLRFRMDGRRAGLELPGLAVVKVVVPRCENALADPLRMGPRLLARVTQGA